MTKGKWSLVCFSAFSLGVFALSLIATPLVSARPGHGRFGRGGPGLFPFRVLQTLDLADTQQANIDAIKAAHAETLKGLRNDLREARKGIVDKLLAAGDVTTKDFATQQADQIQIHAALFDELLAMGLEIRAELSPQQLATAAAAIERKRERHAEKREMHEMHEMDEEGN